MGLRAHPIISSLWSNVFEVYFELIEVAFCSKK